MKNLLQFIKESTANISIIFNDVVADFIPLNQHGGQKGIIFELPKNATRDTIQNYLDQCILPYLPCGEKNEDVQKYIGRNLDAITDINLTYENIEKDPNKFHLLNNHIDVIKFNKSFGDEYTNNLEEVMLTNLKFTLTFSQFSIDNVAEIDSATEDDCKGLLEDQFISLADAERTSTVPLRFVNVEFNDYSIEEE